MKNHCILYKKHKHTVGTWEIWSESNMIHMKAKTSEHHTPIVHTELVEKGKAGRNLDQQVKLRVEARIRGKLDSGYVLDREDTKKELTNQLGLFQPMLAVPYQNIRGFNEQKGYYYQNKLNGHRCLITRIGDSYYAYSRRGKEITTIDHIIKHLDFPEGMTLDGELYIHGVPLQTIASWAKRKQPDTVKLHFVVYDCIMPEISFKNRYEALKSLNFKGNTILLEARELNSTESSIVDLLNVSKANGYEGLILRDPNITYEIGRRSKGLLKVKSCFDNEYKIVDIVKAERADWGVLICKLPNGKCFRVSAPGTNFNKQRILHEKEKYIGKMVTVEYAELTNDGVPFHGVALQIRDDI